jgi:hypothetical protein
MRRLYIMTKKKDYVAPRRKDIKEAVCALLPHVDPKLIRKLDWWALYTIHQDIVKDGKDAETLARKLVKGYDPEKIKAEQEKAAARKAREAERKRRAKELFAKKVEAKRKAAVAKAKARAAKEAARVKAASAKRKAKSVESSGSPSVATTSKPTVKPAAKGKGSPLKSAYTPPVRRRIKDELVKLMPMIKRSDLTGIDYWALYTMHSEIVKYGRDPESMARKFVKGYTKAKK